MAEKALFNGLIFDEFGKPVQQKMIGTESFYAVDDNGFLRHIPSETVDRQILHFFTERISGNEDELAKAAAQFTGKEDIFSLAIFKSQLKHIEKEINALFTSGFPAVIISMMKTSGFRVTINVHGDVLDINLPSPADGE